MDWQSIRTIHPPREVVDFFAYVCLELISENNFHENSVLWLNFIISINLCDLQFILLGVNSVNWFHCLSGLKIMLLDYGAFIGRRFLLVHKRSSIYNDEFQNLYIHLRSDSGVAMGKCNGLVVNSPVRTHIQLQYKLSLVQELYSKHLTVSIRKPIKTHQHRSQPSVSLPHIILSFFI